VRLRPIPSLTHEPSASALFEDVLAASCHRRQLCRLRLPRAGGVPCASQSFDQATETTAPRVGHHRKFFATEAGDAVNLSATASFVRPGEIAQDRHPWRAR